MFTSRILLAGMALAVGVAGSASAGVSMNNTVHEKGSKVHKFQKACKEKFAGKDGQIKKCVEQMKAKYATKDVKKDVKKDDKAKKHMKAKKHAQKGKDMKKTPAKKH